MGPHLPTGCHHSPPHAGSLDTVPLVSPVPTQCSPRDELPGGPCAPTARPVTLSPSRAEALRTRKCVNRCSGLACDPLQVQAASVPPHSCERAGAAWFVCRVRRACPHMLKPGRGLHSSFCFILDPSTQSRHSTVPSGLVLLTVIRAKGRKTGRTAGPRGRRSRRQEGRAGALWCQEGCSFSGTAQDSGRPPGRVCPSRLPAQHCRQGRVSCRAGQEGTLSNTRTLLSQGPRQVRTAA